MDCMIAIGKIKAILDDLIIEEVDNDDRVPDEIIEDLARLHSSIEKHFGA